MKKGDVISRTISDVQDVEPYEVQAEVNWVVGDEAGIKFLSPPDYKGTVDLITNLSEWTVVVESAPTYQSSVAQMTEEQLRASIDGLRCQRVLPPKTPRVTVKREKADPITKALGQLGGAELEAMKKKLGMVD